MSIRPWWEKDIRTGSVLAMVLTTLLVTMLLGLALIKTVFVHHRQMQVLSRQQQCFWLTEAGIQRAVQRLTRSPDYQGEQWEVSAEVLGTAQTAVVTIEVTQVAGPPAAQKIQVEARFPSDRLQRNASRQECVIAVSPNPGESS